jgi:hypothetical protein
MEPIIGSYENKIQLLKARKTELLLIRDLAKNADEISQLQDLITMIEEAIIRHNHFMIRIRTKRMTRIVLGLSHLAMTKRKNVS